MKNRFYILILISLFAISGCGISFNSKYEDNNSINITLEYNNGIGDFDIQNNIKKGSRFPSSGNLDEYFIYKKGYSFEGWYLNENFSGESFKYSYINKDLKLYAKWNELGDNINQVVFNSNGGNYISPIILNNGESISLVSPIKTNYLFTGWYNSKTLTGDPIWKIENVNHDTLLYAKWIEESDYLEDINNIEEKYTINFFANYAEGKMEPQIFYKGISQKIRINTFYQVDPNIIYEFIGWSTSLSGNVIFLDEELISIDNNMTLFAKFREYKPGFTLKYEPNGGTGQMRIQKFTDNETQLIQKNSFIPPDDSLKFIGWGVIVQMVLFLFNQVKVFI